MAWCIEPKTDPHRTVALKFLQNRAGANDRGRPGDDHVDSPPIPKKSQLMLHKYFITITSKSGQTTTVDPHVLSGGSY
jgi:hypothetical protein